MGDSSSWLSIKPDQDSPPYPAASRDIQKRMCQEKLEAPGGCLECMSGSEPHAMKSHDQCRYGPEPQEGSGLDGVSNLNVSELHHSEVVPLLLMHHSWTDI